MKLRTAQWDRKTESEMKAPFIFHLFPFYFHSDVILLSTFLAQLIHPCYSEPSDPDKHTPPTLQPIANHYLVNLDEKKI